MTEKFLINRIILALAETVFIFYHLLAWMHVFCLTENVFCLTKKMKVTPLERCSLYRSSHQRHSVNKVVLKNFARFTGKHLCWSFLFNKVAGLQTCNVFKRQTLAQFSCEFYETFMLTFLHNTFRRLLLKRIWQEMVITGVRWNSCSEMF